MDLLVTNSLKVLLKIAALVCLALSAEAHNPLSARFELKLEKPVSVFTAAFSQDGLHLAITEWCAGTNLNKFNATEYKQLVVQYVKDNTQLLLNNTPLILGEGGIKLGSHQTDLRFVVTNVPDNPTKLSVMISCGQEHDYHQSVFWIFGPNGLAEKAILSEMNNYRARFSW